MRSEKRAIRSWAAGVRFALLLGAASSSMAHHPVSAKFDPSEELTLSGRVTYVDWRNPHAHVFMNVTRNGETQNWAVELESPVLLGANGWDSESLRPGDEIVVEGPRARNETRQVWADSLELASTGRQVYSVAETRPAQPLAKRPVPRWPDSGRPALGATPGTVGGYWAFPSETALVEDGVEVEMNKYGLLENVGDAARVAPLRDWALALYRHRQERELQDDPTYLNCKPPGGPRQYQSALGFQLIEDRKKSRVFTLMGSGNRNFRIMYLDGREPTGQVAGDDDNPLYYGRSVGKWDGDTLEITTTGFNEDFWFSNGGLPHTSLLELTERFTRTSQDTLEYEVTVNDPGAYTRPWTASWRLQWVGGKELPAHFCQNNRP